MPVQTSQIPCQLVYTTVYQQVPARQQYQQHLFQQSPYIIHSKVRPNLTTQPVLYWNRRQTVRTMNSIERVQLAKCTCQVPKWGSYLLHRHHRKSCGILACLPTSMKFVIFPVFLERPIKNSIKSILKWLLLHPVLELAINIK